MLTARDMQIGDRVEFESDMQTEKGPSGGTVITATENAVVIAHSDHPGETFERHDLQVSYARNKKNRVYWALA